MTGKRAAEADGESKKKDGTALRAERDLLRLQLADWNKSLELRLAALAPYAGAFAAAHEEASYWVQQNGTPPYEERALGAAFLSLVRDRETASRKAHPYRLAVAEAERVVKETKRLIRIINEELR
jgi:hypothetical protein